MVRARRIASAVTIAGLLAGASLTFGACGSDDGATENGWVLTAKEEPDWDFPLVMARLIRAPLRRPFSGDGSVFRIGVRGDGGGPTVIYRQIRLYVQESAILRFLNALGGTAFTEFEDRVDRDENAWLRVVFAAMREDARAALGP